MITLALNILAFIVIAIVVTAILLGITSLIAMLLGFDNE